MPPEADGGKKPPPSAEKKTSDDTTDAAAAAAAPDEHHEATPNKKRPAVASEPAHSDNKEAGEDDFQAAATAEPAIGPSGKKKRMCRFPGCTRVIKSQGHCQRHGAKAKRCRLDGCDKQAQGTHDGMCKRHWKAAHASAQANADGEEEKAPAPVGDSVYDHILPQSIAFRPSALPPGDPDLPSMVLQNNVMPLITFLRENADKPPGWHRNQERQARGIHPVPSLSCQLEAWERQLALVEILLLSGGTPHTSFRDLAHAWGREKGFHVVLTNLVCERRGEVERKRRSDLGKALSEEEKVAFREKLQKGRKSVNLPSGDGTPNATNKVGGLYRDQDLEEVAEAGAEDALKESPSKRLKHNTDEDEDNEEISEEV